MGLLNADSNSSRWVISMPEGSLLSWMEEAWGSKKASQMEENVTKTHYGREFMLMKLVFMLWREAKVVRSHGNKGALQICTSKVWVLLKRINNCQRLLSANIQDPTNYSHSKHTIDVHICSAPLFPLLLTTFASLHNTKTSPININSRP